MNPPNATAGVELEDPPRSGLRNGEAVPRETQVGVEGRIQELIERVEALPNPAARALLHECLQALLGLYGQGLGRVLEIARNSGTAGQDILDQYARDDLLQSLLLIHGLHPLDLETRLRRALDKVRPYMESHGGNVEIIALDQDFARLRLQGACKSCPSSAVTLELAVRRAIEEACPDLAGFAVEGDPHVPGHSR